MKKRTNKESIVQFLILILTSCLIIFGLISGKMNKFVHPRFHVGLWISAFILLVFAISVLSERKKGWHNVNLRQYLIYLIPLIFALVFPPVGTSSSAMILAENKNVVNPTSNDSQTDSDVTDYTDVNEYLQETQDVQNMQDAQYAQDDSSIQDTQVIQEEQDLSDKSEMYSNKEVDGSFIIDDASFANWYMDLYDNIDEFDGKKYQFLAQVYSMEGLEENQFLAGRYFMVCCAVDLTGYGIICESEMSSELKEDQWITVTATITKGEYDGMEVPILTDAKISEAEAPQDEYIYYNY